MCVCVKTQDGFLEFCQNVFMKDYYSDESMVSVCTFDSSAREVRILGNYRCEERAEEVVRMIQKHINNLESFRAKGYYIVETYKDGQCMIIDDELEAVFEMPEE